MSLEIKGELDNLRDVIDAKNQSINSSVLQLTQPSNDLIRDLEKLLLERDSKCPENDSKYSDSLKVMEDWIANLKDVIVVDNQIIVNSCVLQLIDSFFNWRCEMEKDSKYPENDYECSEKDSKLPQINVKPFKKYKYSSIPYHHFTNHFKLPEKHLTRPEKDYECLEKDSKPPEMHPISSTMYLPYSKKDSKPPEKHLKCSDSLKVMEVGLTNLKDVIDADDQIFINSCVLQLIHSFFHWGHEIEKLSPERDSKFLESVLKYSDSLKVMEVGITNLKVVIDADDQFFINSCVLQLIHSFFHWGREMEKFCSEKNFKQLDSSCTIKDMLFNLNNVMNANIQTVVNSTFYLLFQYFYKWGLEIEKHYLEKDSRIRNPQHQKDIDL
ncbi:hypothetical protein QTN25_007490 [Entamoeba marina]